MVFISLRGQRSLRQITKGRTKQNRLQLIYLCYPSRLNVGLRVTPLNSLLLSALGLFACEDTVRFFSAQLVTESCSFSLVHFVRL